MLWKRSPVCKQPDARKKVDSDGRFTRSATELAAEARKHGCSVTRPATAKACSKIWGFWHATVLRPVSTPVGVRLNREGSEGPRTTRTDAAPVSRSRDDGHERRVRTSCRRSTGVGAQAESLRLRLWVNLPGPRIQRIEEAFSDTHGHRYVNRFGGLMLSSAASAASRRSSSVSNSWLPSA